MPVLWARLRIQSVSLFLKYMFWVWHQTEFDGEFQFGDLGSVDYSFIAITPSTTLTRIDITC